MVKRFRASVKGIMPAKLDDAMDTNKTKAAILKKNFNINTPLFWTGKMFFKPRRFEHSHQVYRREFYK